MTTSLLSPRLRAVADLVPIGHRLTDVGTDHGHLAIQVVAEGRAPTAVAVDVAAGPLEAARSNVRRSGLTTVEVRRSDGLAAVLPEEAEVVVIAGMGARSMLSILKAARGRGMGRRALVLQPNTDWPAVRAGVADLGYRVVDEVLLEESGRHYLTLRAEPGAGPPLDALDLALGPVARRTRSPGYLAWLRSERDRLRRAVAAAGEQAPVSLLESVAQVEAALQAQAS